MSQKNNQRKKVAAITFGCKINQYETTCILAEFLAKGWEQVAFHKSADAYIINSCTVTNRTDYKSRNAIRKALKHKAKNPLVKIVVTGCYAQRNFLQVKNSGDIDFIIDNNHKSCVYDAVNTGISPQFKEIQQAQVFCEQSTDNMLSRTRAVLKVQDGCSYFCAYCAVAHARGPSRSRAPDKIIQQVNRLVDCGYKEVVLAGINLGLYGKEKKDNYFLPQLLKDLEDIKGLRQIRLSSIEPQLFTAELLEFFVSSHKLCPHFHIPLQSGSDELLKKMGRHYSSSEFSQTIDKIIKIYPQAAFGFDVICGLPGETEKLYQETRLFLEKMPLAYLHVFPYSRRPGTRAFDMTDQINGAVSHQRVLELTDLAKTKNQLYRKKLIDNKTILKVVIEEQKAGCLTGLSDHYVRVHLPDSTSMPGDLVTGQAQCLYNDDLIIKELR